MRMWICRQLLFLPKMRSFWKFPQHGICLGAYIIVVGIYLQIVPNWGGACLLVKSKWAKTPSVCR